MRNLLIIIAVASLLFSCVKYAPKKTEVKTDNTALAEETCEWKHVINWFEIPAVDFERAKTFYETIMDIKMETMVDTSNKEMGSYYMAFFADMTDSTIVNGAITKSEDFLPCEKGGVVVYLNANPDLSVALGKVEAAGGKIIYPKTAIGENNEHGFMAMFIDTEGNTMALHSIK